MTYLIIGGTGTLGRSMTKALLEKSDARVRILSRDEQKQKQMQKEFNNDKRLTFIIGDIRDRDSTFRNLAHCDVVFHFAALKHVDSMEENPEECIKTNVMGTINVADAAQSCKVKHVVFSSTDKAVDPINTYGYCKAISEKILFRRNELQDKTKFSVFRWGNVCASNGSVIPHFVDCMKNDIPVGITDERMTRFLIKIEDAVDFMLKNYVKAPLDEACIPPMKSAPILLVVEALSDLLKKDKITWQNIGIRRGEKIHEAMQSIHSDNPLTSDTSSKFTKRELKQLLRDFI